MRMHATILSIVLLAASAAAQTAINDVFDRANGTNLGADWAEMDGDAVIAGNKLQGNSPFFFGWSLHTAYAAPYASTVIRAAWSMNGGGGDRVSIVAGANAAWNGIEVRIADNDGDGLADRIFWHAAINAGTWFGGSLFSDLQTPLASGEVTLWFTNGGDTANIDIENTVTQTSETFSASGILANPPAGTGVAIGYFGNGTVDDFRAWTGAPTGPVYTLTTPRTGQVATFLVTDAQPNGAVALAYSLAGSGPIPTPLGGVQLSLPIFLLATLNTDANGRAELPTVPLPGSLSGVTLHTQAIDLVAPALTNGFTATVL